MRRVGLCVSLFAALLSTHYLNAQIPIQPPNVNRPIPHFPKKQAPAAVHLRAGVVSPPVLTAKNVVLVTCSSVAQLAGASQCGYVSAPLDREHPDEGTISIYFEQYLNASGGPAVSAILGNFGGPGYSTTGSRNGFLTLFGANLDVHDLLLIDDRGRGLSSTIYCPDLQNGTAAFDRAVEECAAQLGSGASFYGTGDVAEDTDAVRVALGYDKVDYYGGSYGGADVTAYATRFGQHLRSIVLDAPFGTPGEDQLLFEQYRSRAEVPTTSRQCRRSPLCSVDHLFPDAELDLLVLTLRLSPVVGYAYNTYGNLVEVRMDEDALVNFVLDNPTGPFLSTGEVLAAADSLRQGDPQPLLRLGAEGYFSIDASYGDPTLFSYGALLATACVDVREPWDWSDPVGERASQYAEAVRSLPRWYFAPISKSVATGKNFSFFGRDCLNWQKPTPSAPIALPNAIYPPTPTLVLTGDLDRRVPYAEVSKVAALFPNSTLVSVTEAGHETVDWGQCPIHLASGFVETLSVPDTTCAKSPETVWASVGRFPLYAKDARPAQPDSSGTNQIGLQEEKVVSVAVATAVDAIQRSIINNNNGNGFGLRGGTFHTDYSSTWTITLTNCVFANDISVNGTIHWYGDNSLDAELTVSGPGTAGGTLSVSGGWLVDGGPLGNFSVTGALGGQKVAVLVPEA